MPPSLKAGITHGGVDSGGLVQVEFYYSAHTPKRTSAHSFLVSTPACLPHADLVFRRKAPQVCVR